MVSGGSPDIAARHSLLLVWRWLEAMGRRSLRCGVIRAHLYWRDGPVRAESPRRVRMTGNTEHSRGCEFAIARAGVVGRTATETPPPHSIWPVRRCGFGGFFGCAPGGACFRRGGPRRRFAQNDICCLGRKTDTPEVECRVGRETRGDGRLAVRIRRRGASRWPIGVRG